MTIAIAMHINGRSALWFVSGFANLRRRTSLSALISEDSMPQRQIKEVASRFSQGSREWILRQML